jgi:two-component system chemotaxis response regulator CheB
MPKNRVFAIGASAGGVEALREIFSGIPADFPGTILIVQHTPENGLGTLADLLARRANIPVVLASDRLVMRHGMAYVAPPGRHMVASEDRLLLQAGPSVNRHRPAIDPLFRSVAEVFGRRSVGVILTGYLDDGTAGLIAIREAGGIVIVQDPDDAAVPSMPLSALQYVTPDFCVPIGEIASRMTALAKEDVADSEPPPEPAKGKAMAPEKQPSETQHNKQKTTKTQPGRNLAEVSPPIDPSIEPHNGKVSVFVCPECMGTLWEADNHDLLQFRCRVGHTLSAETMYNGQAENVEKALWTAVRVLQEHADLSLRLAERARKSGHQLAEMRFEDRFKEATRDLSMLTDLLTKTGLIDEQDAHTAD